MENIPDNQKKIRTLLSWQWPILIIPLLFILPSVILSLWQYLAITKDSSQTRSLFYEFIIPTIENPLLFLVYILWIIAGIRGVRISKKYKKTEYRGVESLRIISSLMILFVGLPLLIFLIVQAQGLLLNPERKYTQTCTMLQEAYTTPQKIASITPEIFGLTFEDGKEVMLSGLDFKNQAQFDTITRDDLHLIGKEVTVVVPPCTSDFMPIFKYGLDMNKVFLQYRFKSYYPAQILVTNGKVYLNGQEVTQNIIKK